MNRVFRFTFLTPALLLLLFHSCIEGEAYYHYRHIDMGRWHADSLLLFDIDSGFIKTESIYSIAIELYTAHNYPYRDIWLQVDHNLSDKTFESDTLHFLLANSYGRWTGTGVGGLNRYSVPFKSAVSLDSSSLYQFSIRHIMRDNILIGVDRVGVIVAAD